ncbi:hypothetical protein TRFO_30529 [Tritrichomonas foetus]|uniref:Initiator binding domain-containing protein n=1 Tax=Tritrichomonas foetus TaxID=1144522 RepID=A0A1J4JTF5_9EUKA|nr:hypothetical protein TRFO_30529 [Tritrichomonas foetus]|eukprot:OHT02399.1 hypothetical protein TRFO_30529 [Tritrichomonas foetus]
MPRKHATEQAPATPQYWDLIPKDDQIQYQELREQLSAPKYKNRRNKSHEVFKDMIELIHSFSVRGDDFDWKRSLVCGIIWLDSSIAINTHQLRLLVDKCKSSINGSFQSIGYETVPTGTESASELISKFPFMRNNFAELRQWTVRQKLLNPLPQISSPSDVPSSLITIKTNSISPKTSNQKEDDKNQNLSNIRIIINNSPLPQKVSASESWLSNNSIGAQKTIESPTFTSNVHFSNENVSSQHENQNNQLLEIDDFFAHQRNNEEYITPPPNSIGITDDYFDIGIPSFFGSESLTGVCDDHFSSIMIEKDPLAFFDSETSDNISLFNDKKVDDNLFIHM